MGVSRARKVWRDIKARNPEFTSPKVLKFDVGPNLDKLSGYLQDFVKIEATVSARFAELDQAVKAASKALDAYKKDVPLPARGQAASMNMIATYNEFDAVRREIDLSLDRIPHVLAERKRYAKDIGPVLKGVS